MVKRWVSVNDGFALPTEVQQVLDTRTQALTPLTSVAGRTGAVTLTKNDVGLSNADNTADASKPVSTPQAAALAPKTALYLQGTATGNEATAIQAVLDAAGADEIVRLYGTFTTASTITVKGNLDASGAVINYSGTSIAVQVGDATVRSWKRVICPRVVNINKSGTGWAGVSGSVGIKLVNLHACPVVVIPHIQSFETGLLMYGQGQGLVFNNIYLGHLDNNKINHQINADSTGWVNQNNIIGGEYGHNSAEGTNVSGVKHLAFATGLTNVPNNNTWQGSSFEADIPEWHLDIAGQNNMFINCRYEVTGGARVRWQADAVHNQIIYGYKSDSLVETVIAGALRNHILSHNRWKVATGFGAIFENTASGATAAITIMDAGGIAAGAAPSTAYALKIAATTLGMKQPADAFDRIQFSPANSRLYLGSGTVAVARYLTNLGSSAIGVGGGDFAPAADNTLDNGIASLRWRYIRAGTAIQTGAAATGSRPAAATAGAGAMFFDTTLVKPIWSDGTNWKDATGTTV